MGQGLARILYLCTSFLKTGKEKKVGKEIIKNILSIQQALDIKENTKPVAYKGPVPQLTGVPLLKRKSA